mmetsp:Transcript_130180/g.278189  ORF Transcript_130180/g.278189 Transcript_130180/m.278189 type:complete len:261 (-) Transcript_130180:112-894(-)
MAAMTKLQWSCTTSGARRTRRNTHRGAGRPYRRPQPQPLHLCGSGGSAGGLRLQTRMRRCLCPDRPSARAARPWMSWAKDSKDSKDSWSRASWGRATLAAAAAALAAPVPRWGMSERKLRHQVYLRASSDASLRIGNGWPRGWRRRLPPQWRPRPSPPASLSLSAWDHWGRFWAWVALLRKRRSKRGKTMRTRRSSTSGARGTPRRGAWSACVLSTRPELRRRAPSSALTGAVSGDGAAPGVWRHRRCRQRRKGRRTARV